MTERTAMIAKIHVAKRDLGLDEDTYRAMLQLETGKTSCSTMSAQELEKVLAAYKARGWQPKASPRRYSPKTRNKPPHKKNLVDRLRAQWIHMHQLGVLQDGSEAALERWVKRQTVRLNGVGVDRVDWLARDSRMATTVLESLKKWEDRQRADWRNQDLRLIALQQRAADCDQVSIIRQLLAARRIMWWPVFESLGIEPQADYVRNRKALCHD